MGKFFYNFGYRKVFLIIIKNIEVIEENIDKFRLYKN